MTNTLKAFSAPAAILSALTIAACSQPASDNAPATEAEAPDAQDAFFANLTELCGQRFEGEVITDDPVDVQVPGRHAPGHRSK